MGGRKGRVGLGELERPLSFWPCLLQLTRQALALLESRHREAETREKLRKMKRRREAKGQAREGAPQSVYISTAATTSEYGRI